MDNAQKEKAATTIIQGYVAPGKQVNAPKEENATSGTKISLHLLQQVRHNNQRRKPNPKQRQKQKPRQDLKHMQIMQKEKRMSISTNTNQKKKMPESMKKMKMRDTKVMITKKTTTQVKATPDGETAEASARRYKSNASVPSGGLWERSALKVSQE